MKTILQVSVGRLRVPGRCLIFLTCLLIAMLCPAYVAASIKISGTVTDTDNEPLVGATIIEVGTGM